MPILLWLFERCEIVIFILLKYYEPQGNNKNSNYTHQTTQEKDE